MQDYSIPEMKRFLKGFSLPKRKKEMCVAGIEMLLLTKDDIAYIADNSTTEQKAQNFLHKKIMEM